MGLFCTHEWEQTLEIAEKGIAWAKKGHSQHKCKKCGKLELCNQDETNPDYSLLADDGTDESHRSKCSKCGKVNEGWFDNPW